MFPGFITVDNIHINNFSSKPQSFLTSKIYFIIKSYYPLWPLLPNLQLPFHSSNYIFIPEPRLYSLLYLILLRQLCQVVFNSTVMAWNYLLPLTFLPLPPTYPTWAFQGLCKTFLFCSRASSSPTYSFVRLPLTFSSPWKCQFPPSRGQYNNFPFR